MFLISDLCLILESYLDKEGIELVYKAYLFGAEAHDGQTRMSGEPYIYHPIAVARILADMRMDAQTLVAAMLHDVIEDTEIAKEQVADEFGQEVAEIVDGLTKLDNIKFNSKDEAKAESFRKLVLAMVNDLRVILIKLADRLHNMRTLGAMAQEKKVRIARETLDIYAPIANRLGMSHLRYELEELGFQACNPMRYRVLKESVDKIRGNRREVISKLKLAFTERLESEKMPSIVDGREKHLFSIYKKMRTKHLPFDEVFDVYGFRICVQTVDDCYRTLGIIHNLFKPVPGKFKDYIAIPKINGYQSLHTVLFSPMGVPIEVQIRTKDMHTVAENGVASHWVYKASTNSDDDISLAQKRTRQWLQNLLDIQQHAGDSIEFLENVKIDLFPDEVYVFTPKGKIMELPRGATAVDFAYAVHTGVGNSCVGVKINHQVVPLNSVLHNGDTIEIKTVEGSNPNPSWLNFVFTAKARSNIRHTLKAMHKEESIVLGERLLNRCLSKVNMNLYDIPESKIDALIDEYKLDSLDDLLFDLGMGKRLPQLVARQLLPQEIVEEQDQNNEQLSSLAIKGTEGTVVSYAKCCHPIPGDEIIGNMSSGRGLVIHTKDCVNVQEMIKMPEKWFSVEWSDNVEGEFNVALRLLVEQKKGVLAIVASIISGEEANIEKVTTTDKEGNYSYIDFIISVRNRIHLANLIKKIRHESFVARISRF
ncbi:MAG: RelA/SpoT family protein [Gammaproteobacteria bacterium]|nr:RelA/SpoT family protein [Gammaproteobacteria bacterium]